MQNYVLFLYRAYSDTCTHAQNNSYLHYLIRKASGKEIAKCKFLGTIFHLGPLLSFSAKFTPEQQVRVGSLLCAKITPSPRAGLKGALSRQAFLNQPGKDLCCPLKVFKYSGVGLWVFLKKFWCQCRHPVIQEKLSHLFHNIHKFCSVPRWQIPRQILKISPTQALAFSF